MPVTFTFSEIGSVPVSVSVGPDALKADNTYNYAARVSSGLKVLVVNGDPSSDKQRSEPYFYQTALSPSDDAAQEFDFKEVSEGEFEGMVLDDYQVIFLCNLYRVTEDRVAALTRFVEAGGGLAIFLGDQVDENIYNKDLFAEGNGLLPARPDRNPRR